MIHTVSERSVGVTNDVGCGGKYAINEVEI